MAHDGFEDVCFPKQYPQQDIAEHEVFMSFSGDDDALAFLEWWQEEGKVMFQDYLNRSRP